MIGYIELTIERPPLSPVLRTLRAGESMLIGSGEECEIRVAAEGSEPVSVRLIWSGQTLLLDASLAPQEVALDGLRVVAIAPFLEGRALSVGAATIVWRWLSNEEAPTGERGARRAGSGRAAAETLRDELAGGRYGVGPELNRGAFGCVFEAEEKPLRRQVALKRLFAAESESDQHRFVEEARITGQLEHPSIVPVHELGVDDQGRIFYTMKLIRGHTLAEVIRRVAEPVAGAPPSYDLHGLLTIFQKVADAVAFAHSKGVIHRDLKPANIMVGEFGEAVVTDWGLAKAAKASSADAVTPATKAKAAGARVRTLRDELPDVLLTQVGEVIGTPAYMAPEQARADAAPLDEKADIYSLGAILYTILTLRPPVELPEKEAQELAGLRRDGRERDTAFWRDALPKLLDRVRKREIALLVKDGVRSLPAGLPHLRSVADLESLVAIVQGALAWDPADRYASVKALQADLGAYQAGFAPVVEHASAWKQARLFVRRNQAVSAAVAIALALLALLTSGYLWGVRRAQQRADFQRNFAEERLYFSHMLLAGRDLSEGRLENARVLLDRHRREPSARDLRGWEWFLLYGQLSTETLQVTAHPTGVNVLAVSADGLRVATLGQDGWLALWEPRGLKEIHRWPAHDSPGAALAWDREGARLASSDLKGTVRVWNATGRLLAERPSTSGKVVEALGWEPTGGPGARLAIAGFDPEIRFWKPAAAEPETVETLVTTKEGAHSLSWSPDARHIALGMVNTAPATVVYEVETRTLEAGWRAPAGSDIYAVAYHPKEASVASGAKHLHVSVYDLDDPDGPVWGKPLHRNFVSSLAWQPEGDLLASGSHDGTVRISAPGWEEEAPIVLSGNTGKIQSLAWMAIPALKARKPAANVLFAAGSDGALRAWAGTNPPGQKAAFAGLNWVSQARWQPSGKLIAVSCFRSDLFLIDAARGSLMRRIPTTRGIIFDVAWSPDGRRLACGHKYSGTVSVLDAETGDELMVFEQPETRRVAWDPSGRYIAAGGLRDTRIFDTLTGKPLHLIPRTGGRTAWHPGGKLLAVGTYEGALELWDAQSGKLVRSLRQAPPPVPGIVPDPNEPPRFVSDVAWSRQGDRLAFVTQDTVAQIIVPDTGAILQSFSGHSGGIWCVSWNSDGTRLATGGQDGSVRIYNAATGDQVALIAHGAASKEISALDWSRDGQALLTGGFDRAVRVWDIGRGQVRDRARRLEEQVRAVPADRTAWAKLMKAYVRLGQADQARATASRLGLGPTGHPYLESVEKRLDAALHAEAAARR